MSTATLIKVVAVFYGLALVLSALAAHAQETTRLPTIADCPAGYTLGVEDTDQPMPIVIPQGSYDDTGHASNSYADTAAETAKQNASAPRQFMTGCIPPQPKQ